MAVLKKVKLGTTTYDINSVHSCYNGTGTAAVTTSPYTFAKWECSLPEVTSLYDGLTIVYKVPVAGNGSYGTCLQVNSLGYHPVVRAANSAISTRYGVNYTVFLTYNSTISGTVYNNSASSSSISGCWVVTNDVDNDTTNSYMITDYYRNGWYVKEQLYRYHVLLTTFDKKLVPISNGNDQRTSTTKTYTTQEFDPFGPIFYYNSTTSVTANSRLAGDSILELKHHNFDIRYSFNIHGSPLTLGQPVFIVADIQSNGSAKLASTPIATALPSTADGHIYIYLGQANTSTATPSSTDTYTISLMVDHPVYQYKNGKICIVTNNDGNITGSGTSGYLVKWNGTNSLTDGPQLGSGTTTFLRNDGTWVTPANNAVTQTATTATSVTNYEVLFSATADNTTRTEGARKTNTFLFDPSQGNLQVTQLNGVTIGNNPQFTDADSYVYTAAFADDTTSNSANPVKMTLTRTGTITGSVIANIPKVSSTSAGVAPKGASVSTQSQSTKFLREDGTWAAPSYTVNTNTTYTFANGTNGFTVTPSGGSAQTVTVTPSITNNVTGSGTSGYLVKWSGANTITNGPQLGSGTTTYLRNDGQWATPPDNDTKNTAGSTNTTSKFFVIGATSQATNPQTYSNSAVFVTNGTLDATVFRVAAAVSLVYNSTTQALDFTFA